MAKESSEMFCIWIQVDWDTFCRWLGKSIPIKPNSPCLYTIFKWQKWKRNTMEHVCNSGLVHLLATKGIFAVFPISTNPVFVRKKNKISNWATCKKIIADCTVWAPHISLEYIVWNASVGAIKFSHRLCPSGEKRASCGFGFHSHHILFSNLVENHHRLFTTCSVLMDSRS